MAGQGKRPTAGSSKKIVKPSSADDGTDGSYIVFSTAKGDTKGHGKKQSVIKDSRAAASTADDTTKKPDIRALIGGPSWTGKLPVNLLSEHCQKQKWDRPEYTMMKTAEGFASTVLLKAINPKTKEILSLPAFRVPPSHKHLAVQRTALEARHFAATYALFRICSMKNIHTMLPPIYRSLWKGEFQVLKIDDLKEGRAWLYEADPFAAKQAQDQRKTLQDEKHDAAANQGGQGERTFPARGTHSSSGTNGSGVRSWTDGPNIEMGKQLRAQVEDLVRKHTKWNPYNSKISESQRNRIVEDLTGLGFRKSHIEEASKICKDPEEVLEWLLVHVPEDDLPKWALPEGYASGISVASGNIKREASVKRLADAGYSTELCAKTLDDHFNDEAEAAEALQNLLINREERTAEISTMAKASECILDAWEEELETLDSIFGNRYEKLNLDSCRVALNLDSRAIKLCIRKSKAYPSTLPIISLSKDLPAYIRLSIYRQALDYAIRNLLGAPMVFNIVDWLETNIPLIVENPGKLYDVAVASSTVSATAAEKSATLTKFKTSTIVSPQAQSAAGDNESLEILRCYQERQKTTAQQKMQKHREILPAWSVRDEIVDTVNFHQVTIISGETGSGKSTQAVQFVLDDLIQRKLGSSANIVCTQPRRISALSLADRVSDERCCAIGTEVGFSIRGESKHTQGTTKITFVTTGVLLRRLQSSGGSSHNILEALSHISHVFIDEVHERSLDTDFLLVLLQTALKLRKDFKVILMSATLDADVFERYFQTISAVGKINIRGRTFAVTDHYLDEVVSMSNFNDGRAGDVAGAIKSIGMRINYDLILAVVETIDAQLESGGILIFLPGVVEINRTIKMLGQLTNICALPIHASLTPAEQRRVFPPAPGGKRKVVVATNVAEASITIDDIIAVIDTGKVKETRYDPERNMVILEEVWASRSACKQRRGRAGRVQSGECFKLYTRNAEAKMAERPDPEIRRVPLEQLCLSVRAMGVTDVPGFLSKALTPPDVASVDGAVATLQKMGALDGDELTALGRHMAMIPADLRLGKLMVYGALFSCLEACITIAAILTVRSPFINSQEVREESKAARSSLSRGQGDLIADLNAYEQWQQMIQSTNQRGIRFWCTQNCLSIQTLYEISSNRSQYLTSLKDIGFVQSTYKMLSPDSQALNAHNSNFNMIRAIIAGSFHPQIARIQFPNKKYSASVSGAIELDPDAKTIRYFTQDTGRVFIHPGSTLFDAQGFIGSSIYVAYFTKIATAKVYIRDLAPFNAYSLLMFAGEISIDKAGRGLSVDGWLRLRGWARIGVLVGRLRGMLDQILARRMERPSEQSSDDATIIGTVRKLVEFDGMDR